MSEELNKMKDKLNKSFQNQVDCEYGSDSKVYEMTHNGEFEEYGKVNASLFALKESHPVVLKKVEYYDVINRYDISDDLLLKLDNINALQELTRFVDEQLDILMSSEIPTFDVKLGFPDGTFLNNKEGGGYEFRIRGRRIK